jgi:hypothetical protein
LVLDIEFIKPDLSITGIQNRDTKGNRMQSTPRTDRKKPSILNLAATEYFCCVRIGATILPTGLQTSKLERIPADCNSNDMEVAGFLHPVHHPPLAEKRPLGSNPGTS